MENKKGNIVSIIWMIGILFVVLFAGLLIAFGGMIVDWTFDEVVPELTTIGIVGDANVSEYTSMAITPVDTFVQSFTWLGGVFYMLALVGCLGMAFAFRFTGNKWLGAFFILCMLLLVIASIFISNIYEEFYNDGSDVSIRLHEQVLLSWLILYGPVILCVIGFVCAIIMFTGDGEEGQLV